MTRSPGGIAISMPRSSAISPRWRITSTAHSLLDDGLSRERRLLIGAYFTHEYSIEAAALGNPSMVPAPDQSGVEPGAVRFIMSLRGIGEGHVSSIEFRSGVVAADASITVDTPSGFVAPGESVAGSSTTRSRTRSSFASGEDVSSRVLFPHSPAESHGLEDARFVRFVDDDADPAVYYATYTAFDGHQIVPHLLETARLHVVPGDAAERCRGEEQGHRDLPSPYRRTVRRARVATTTSTTT